MINVEEDPHNLLLGACLNGDYKRIKKLLSEKATTEVVVENRNNCCNKSNHSSPLLALVHNALVLNHKRNSMSTSVNVNAGDIAIYERSTRSGYEDPFRISNSFVECLKLLLQNHTNVNVKCRKTLNMPLYLACVVGH